MSAADVDGSTDDADSQTLRWTGDRRWATPERPVGAMVVVLALGPFWMLADAVGIAAWLVVAGSWLFFPPVVPVVFGQLVLVGVVPADTTVASILPAEGVLLGLLAASFLDSGAWHPAGGRGLTETRLDLADALGYLGVAIVVAGLVVYAVQSSGPILAGGLCLAVIAVVGVVLRPALPS
jgi:hypothetical protein